MSNKNLILLTQEDLVNIWVLTGNYQKGVIVPRIEPFKEMYSFLKYYKESNPQEFLTGRYSYNPQVDKIDLTHRFCEDFSNQIPVSELFLTLMSSFTKNLKFITCKEVFTFLDKKYDNFFNQLTDALKENKKINFYNEAIVKSWMSLAKNKKINFSGQEIPHFIYETFNDNDAMVVKKIEFFQYFDKDKSQTAINKILNIEIYKTNVKVIEAAQKYFEKNDIKNEKIIIPIIDEYQEQLFHYTLILKPDGLMQKKGVSKNEAEKILIFTAYYLAEHAYYHANIQRTSINIISMKISTPYEHCLTDAKEKYNEALPIVLGEFLTKENINKMVKNPYDENLAKHLKEYIKAAVLHNKISQNISEKPENNLTSPKVKI